MSAPLPSLLKQDERAIARTEQQTSSPSKNYKGFVGGIFSGIAKLSGEPLHEGSITQTYTNVSSQSVIRECESPSSGATITGYLTSETALIRSKCDYKPRTRRSFRAR